MNGHILAGTDIAVDYWKIQGRGGRLVHFLTHLHGDHISGLTSSWHRPIYCSEFTSRLLIIRHGLPRSLLKICVLNESMLVSGHGSSSFTVTAYDANHCPGAVMFYFQGDFGNILYTGDFRASLDLVDSCRHLAGYIDTLYLDNTFCSPKCVFPSREECLDMLIGVVEQHQSHHVLIGVRKLGKETLLAQLGLRLKETVGVSSACYHVSQMLFATDIFTITSQDSRPRIRTVPMHTISRRYMDQLNTTQPTIAVIPSAVYTGLDCQPFCRDTNIFVVPYSDHSSYAELQVFVSMLRPAKVLPIVQQLRGPFGVDISDRADMTCFQGILLKGRPGRHIHNNSMCDGQLGEGITESNKERMFLRERLAQGNMAPTHDFSPWSVCKRDRISHPCKKSRLKSGVRGRKRPATGVVYVNCSADGQESDFSDISHPSQQLTHMMGSGTTSHSTQQISCLTSSGTTSHPTQQISCLTSSGTTSHPTQQKSCLTSSGTTSHPTQQISCLTSSGTTSHPTQQHSHIERFDITSQLLQESLDSLKHRDILQLHAKRMVPLGVGSRHECAIVDSAASQPHSLCDCPLPGECRKFLQEDLCADVVARCDGAHVDERMGSVEMDRHDLVTQQSLTDDSQVDNISSDNPDSPISFKSCHTSAGQCCDLIDQQHWHSLTSTLSDLTDQQHGHSLTSTLSGNLSPRGRSVSSLTVGSRLLKYIMREQCVGGGSQGLKPHIGVDNNLVDGDCIQCDSIHLELVSNCGMLETLIRDVDNRISDSCILLQECVPGDSDLAGVSEQCVTITVSGQSASITESSAASGCDHPGQVMDMSSGCPGLKLSLDSQDQHGVESTSFTSKSSPTAAVTSKSSPTPTIMSKPSPTATIQRGIGGTGLPRNYLCSSGMLRQKQQISELKRHEISHFIASLQEFLRKA